MFKNLINLKMQSINKYSFSESDLQNLNQELSSIEWNNKNETIFIQTLDFIFTQNKNYIKTFLKKLKEEKSFELLLNNFIEKQYPLLYAFLKNKVTIKHTNNRTGSGLLDDLLFMESSNLNDYLKKEIGISSKAISLWLGKNIIVNGSICTQYLALLHLLAIKFKNEKNKNDLILSGLKKLSDVTKNDDIRTFNYIDKKRLQSFSKLESIKKLTSSKIIKLINDEDNIKYLLDTLKMSEEIVKFGLEGSTIQRKKLSIKTLHDNLVSILENKGDINFKFKKENLISKTKIRKHNKKSKKWRYILPNTNREIFKWGSELGHCIGTAKYGRRFKNDELIILGVYKENKLYYTIEIPTIYKQNLHEAPTQINQIEGKSGRPPVNIMKEIIHDLKSIGIINQTHL